MRSGTFSSTFVIGMVAALWSQLLVAQSSEQACCPQIRCEELCLGAKRTCRVIDCDGQITNSFDEACAPPAPKYQCSGCEIESHEGPDGRIKVCYNIYNSADPAQPIVDTKCAFQWSPRSLNCLKERRQDSRCYKP